MTDNVRLVCFRIHPSVPHHLMSKEGVFLNSHRVCHTASAVVLFSAIVGVGAGAFTRFYINEQEVDFTNGQADLSSCSGTINLKATTDNGGLTKLKIAR